MNQHMSELLHTISHAGAVFVLFRGDEGPVDEERASHDVFSRHEAPVAAVEAVQPVVAHGEVVAGRYDEIAVLDVIGQVILPGGGDALSLGSRYVGELVAIGAIAAVVGMTGLRLIL